MGLLDRLLGRDDDDDDDDDENIPDIAEEFTVSEGSRGWLNIEYGGELYHVQRANSETGEYTAAYRDGVQGGTEPDPGRIFLVQDEKLAFTTELDRPNGCAVADDGTVAVVDWGLDWGQDLPGTLHVFDAEGDRLFAHEFDVSVDPVTITPDGAYVATSTGDPDRSTYVFDVDAGKLVLKHRTPGGPISRLGFVDADGSGTSGATERGGDGSGDASSDHEWHLELDTPDRETERITLEGEQV